MKNLLLVLLLSLPMLAAAEPVQTAAAAAETAAPKRPKRKDFALKSQWGNPRFKFSAVGKFRRRGAGCRLSLPKMGRPAAVN